MPLSLRAHRQPAGPPSLPPPAKPTPPPLPPGVKADKEKRGVLEALQHFYLFSLALRPVGTGNSASRTHPRRRGRTPAPPQRPGPLAAAPPRADSGRLRPRSPFGAARNHSKWRPRHHSRLNPPHRAHGAARDTRQRRPPRPLAPARTGGSYRRPVKPRALRGAPPHPRSPLPGHLTADTPPGGSHASVGPLSSPAFPSAGPRALRTGLRPPPRPQRFARRPSRSAGGARAAPWRRAAAASPRPLPGRYLGPSRRRRSGGSRRGAAPRTPLGGGGRLRPFTLPVLRLLSSFVFDVRSGGAAIPGPPSWSGCRGSGADSRTGGSSGFARGQRLPAQEGAQSGGEGKKGANPEVHPPRRRPQGNTRAQTQQCGATSPPPSVTFPPASKKPACRSLLAAARGRRTRARPGRCGTSGRSRPGGGPAAK